MATPRCKDVKKSVLPWQESVALRSNRASRSGS